MAASKVHIRLPKLRFSDNKAALFVQNWEIVALKLCLVRVGECLAFESREPSILPKNEKIRTVKYGCCQSLFQRYECPSNISLFGAHIDSWLSIFSTMKSFMGFFKKVLSPHKRLLSSLGSDDHFVQCAGKAGILYFFGTSLANTFLRLLSKL